MISRNRIFAQTWPHLKRSAGEIIKHKFTQNKSTCKYCVLRLSNDNATNFHAFTVPFQRHGVGRIDSNLIFTLDPNKFAEKKQQCHHIGNQIGFQPNVMLHKLFESCQNSATPLSGFRCEQRIKRQDILALPTRHQILSLLLYAARKTPHCGRTTPPSYIKWCSYIFRKRV
jgi:hypothetical protein